MSKTHNKTNYANSNYYFTNSLARSIENGLAFIIDTSIKAIKLLLNVFNKKYIQFINDHSFAVKTLKNINLKYDFASVQNYEIDNSYDNDIFYDEISPEDYLIYQLIYKSKEITKTINDAENNAKLYKNYMSEVEAAEIWDSFDSDEKPKNLKKLARLEKRIFTQAIKTASVDFTVEVMLIQTNINNRYITHKAEKFNKEAVKSLITKMKDKNGDFYLNRDIWDSICRVERGRVTNKIRFAVYARDDYRCVMCGRKNVDLEVDHIFPIAKGGKSNFDNLQTLCHRCNALKSDTIVEGAIDPRLAKKANSHSNTPVCPNCNIQMVLRKGTYGDFYGCRNYPNCKHTEHK